MVKVILPALLFTWYFTPSEATAQIFIRNFIESWISLLFLILMFKVSEEV